LTTLASARLPSMNIGLFEVARWFSSVDNSADNGSGLETEAQWTHIVKISTLLQMREGEL
jgi:hypothetical protein